MKLTLDHLGDIVGGP